MLTNVDIKIPYTGGRAGITGEKVESDTRVNVSFSPLKLGGSLRKSTTLIRGSALDNSVGSEPPILPKWQLCAVW